MPFSILRALHDTIGQAIDDIEEVYRAHSGEVVPEYPSLDIPYYKCATHAPEIDKAEELRLEPTVLAAANRVVAACGQLSATVHKVVRQNYALQSGDVPIRTPGSNHHHTRRDLDIHFY